ncbi:MAG: o-succinylbenzoate--CoA ligase [Dermatophilaceae bacterium]
MLPVPISTARPTALLDALAAALSGAGPPIVPYAADGAPPAVPRVRPRQLPEGLAVVVSTSGSTGQPKLVMLTADNLLASARAAHTVLGGPGSWLLAIPAHHVGGLQVLVRSILGSGPPTGLEGASGFTAQRFVAAAGRMGQGTGPRYVSLVPTQVTRLLADPRGRQTMAGFDAVLVGGAGTPAATRELARAHGIRLVRTYGMSETAGGCVYDGMPLAVTEIHIDNDRHVVLGGATVAHGYLGQRERSADRFQTDADGVRWFRTDDLGHFDSDGRLSITGRADDLIVTGGLKVAPGPVEDALVRFVPGVRDAVVVGVPDPDWGQVVAAAVTVLTGRDAMPTVRDARAALRGILPDHALPRVLRVLEQLPQLPSGKPDRVSLVGLLGARIGPDRR